MSECIFVTGSDTEVGKTKTTTLLLKRYASEFSIGGWKPIAAGGTADKNSSFQLVNTDALAIQKAQGSSDYAYINPIVYEPPIAPHIAANEANDNLNFERLEREWSLRSTKEHLTLVEGAGGWLLPLNEYELLADWVGKQKWGVIIVVGMRLGCLNHALLTAESVQQRGLTIVGWVANCIQENGMNREEQNIQTLETMMNDRFNCRRMLTIPYFKSESHELEWLQNNSNFIQADAVLKPFLRSKS